MIIKLPAAALLLLAHGTNAKNQRGGPNTMKVKNCNGNGRKCNLDAADFNLDQNEGDITQIDLGSGRTFACKSNGKPAGRGAAFHAECTGTSTSTTEGNGQGNGQNKEKKTAGAMNVIKQGKNSQGQDLIFGSLSVDGEICKIGPDALGEDTVVNCIPEADFPDELDPEEPGDGERTSFRKLVTDPVDQLKQKPNVGLRGRSSDSHHRGLVDDLGGTLDIMVVWTRKAECANSGLSTGCTLTDATENNIRGLIALAVAETNTAYTESGVTTELRLVHAYREETYDESTGFSDALNKVKNNGDGVMDDVHTKRDTYGADLVALIIDNPQSCGIAYLGPSEQNMFSVTKWSCAAGYYSFGHEIGHNMGCNHDKGTSQACSSSDYNYGYRDPEADFRSILAYSCSSGQCDNNAGGGCTRVQRFSNPNFLYNGKAIGNAETDNAQRINDVKATIAAYRVAVQDGPTPPPTPAPTPTPPPTTACDGQVMFVEVFTDNWGGETSWTLKNLCTLDVETGDAPLGNTLYSNQYCFPGDAGGEYEFTIDDSFGDGICCSYGNGYYEVIMGGNVMAEGGTFLLTETSTFGSCPAATPTTPPPAATPTTPPPVVTPTTPPPVVTPTTPPPVESPTTTSPTYFTCSRFNEDACLEAYGGGKCQWLGSCHNCGCVPVFMN